MPLKVAFLDRDGTLIWEPQDTKFVETPEQVKLLPGVAEGLRALKDAGYILVIVSNQGAGPTLAEREAAFVTTQEKTLSLLGEHGISILTSFVCPHLLDDNCTCRKPKTGMVDQFFEKHPIDHQTSIMVGDRETDMEFAKNIDVRFVGMETNGTFPPAEQLLQS
jgi:imidazoleglycerol-phosphate dehydratase/histidinol-phosphatase